MNLCPVHGTETRRVGQNEYCDLCRDGIPALSPSNGKPVMTTQEALWAFHEAAKVSPGLQAAYNVIVMELRTLKAGASK